MTDVLADSIIITFDKVKRYHETTNAPYILGFPYTDVVEMEIIELDKFNFIYRYTLTQSDYDKASDT